MLNVRALVAELIGTFFLVFTIGMTVINPSEYMQDMTPDPGLPAFAPLAIGSVLMVMIFAGGAVAGVPGLMLVLPLVGVIAVLGETLGAIITSPRLRARHAHARRLQLESVTRDLA